MKSYPYIGKDNYGQICLMLSSSYALTMDGCSFTHTPMQEGGYTNITHEYLANTYGEVVSPEHAEFIIELCLENSIRFAADNARRKYFSINNGKLYFFCAEIDASNIGSKKITIPLPPKQIQTATPEEEFEMKQIMKNAGDNLVLGCEDSKCDKWPRVGDEVLIYSKFRRLAEIKGKAVKVIGKCTHSDGDTILTVEHSSLGVFAVAEGLWVKKPKTTEEELRDELAQVLADSYTDVTEVVKCKSTFAHYAKDLMSKYNITKKPQ